MENQKFLNKPSFYNERNEKFCELVIPGKMPELRALMGVKPVSVNSICQYYVRMTCHKFFESGCDAYNVSITQKIPYGTVAGYYKEYLKEFPNP